MNQKYLHMLDLLQKEHQEKKWMKYAALGIIGLGALSYYYAHLSKNRKEVIKNMAINAYITNARLSQQAQINTQNIDLLNQSREEIARLQYENSILSSKILSPDSDNMALEN
jgi:hypothetical protein